MPTMPGSSHTVEDGPKVDANATYARGATHPNTTTYATQAIYCDRCEMWLNGPEALKKHQRQKKHSKNIAKKVLPTFVLTLTEEKEGLYGWSAGGCDILLRPADSLQDVLTAVAAQWELKGHHRVELIFGGVILRGKGNDAISKLLTKHNVPFCSTGRRSVTRTN